MNLLAGTYLSIVPAECRIMGPDRSLSGLVSHLGHISVKALWLKAPEYLNITSIVSPEIVVSLLDQSRFKDLAPREDTSTGIHIPMGNREQNQLCKANCCHITN